MGMWILFEAAKICRQPRVVKIYAKIGMGSVDHRVPALYQLPDGKDDLWVWTRAEAVIRWPTWRT